MEPIDQAKFGAFVAACRKERGLTQKQLAETLHLTDKAVSKWERALSLPDVSTLEPLAEALGVTVTELLHGERLSTAQALPVQEVERLVEGSLQMALHPVPDAREQALRRRWLGLWAGGMAGFLLLRALCLALLRQLGQQSPGDGWALLLWLGLVLGGVFSLCAILLMPARLPAYYDAYPVRGWDNVFFHLSLPFPLNNQNWPAVRRSLFGGSLLTALTCPALATAYQLLEQSALPKLALLPALGELLLLSGPLLYAARPRRR